MYISRTCTVNLDTWQSGTIVKYDKAERFLLQYGTGTVHLFYLRKFDCKYELRYCNIKLDDTFRYRDDKRAYNLVSA